MKKNIIPSMQSKKESRTENIKTQKRLRWKIQKWQNGIVKNI